MRISRILDKVDCPFIIKAVDDIVTIYRAFVGRSVVSCRLVVWTVPGVGNSAAGNNSDEKVIQKCPRADIRRSIEVMMLWGMWST